MQALKEVYLQGCNQSKLSPMQALKEVYLPECGLWVSDYPFLNREAYLECSLEIERERQQEAVQGYR